MFNNSLVSNVKLINMFIMTLLLEFIHAKVARSKAANNVSTTMNIAATALKDLQ